MPSDGYADAFYEIADMLGIPAHAASPKVVWESEMRPRLIRRLTPTASEATAIGAGQPWSLEAATLCSDCPPNGYPTDKTRCSYCPRRFASPKVPSDTAPGVDRAIALVRRIASKESWQSHYGRTWEDEAAEIVAALAASPTASDTDTAIPGGEALLQPFVALARAVDAASRDYLEVGLDGILETSTLPVGGPAIRAKCQISVSALAAMLAASPKPDTDTRVSDATKRMASVMGCEFVPHARDTDTPVDPGVEGVREAVLFTIKRLTVLSDARAEPLADAIMTLVLAAKPSAGMDAGEVEDA